MDSLDTRIRANDANAPESEAWRDIVVLGASAGGLRPLIFLLAQLSGTSAASFFVILHVGPQHPSRLRNVLQRATRMPVVFAADGDPIRPGTVYAGVPDRHLLLESGRIRLSAGPREHWHRPSIDKLFCSAAELYTHRVAGVLLSGALYDGVAGLAAVKRHGGLTIVQHPAEADYPDMALAAIAEGVVDYSVPLAEILRILRVCSGRRAGVADRARTDGARESRDPAGSVRRVPDDSTEALLRTVAACFQEQATVLRRLAESGRRADGDDMARRYEAQAADRHRNAAALRDYLKRLEGGV